MSSIPNQETENTTKKPSSVDFEFSLQSGMIIETTVGEGNAARPIRAVVVSITDIEIIVWPIESVSTQTQMTVLPRSTIQYRISRPARLDEIQQAFAGIDSLKNNWQDAVKNHPSLSSSSSFPTLEDSLSHTGNPLVVEGEEPGTAKVVWK
jgi:hypothetical protein